MISNIKKWFKNYSFLCFIFFISYTSFTFAQQQDVPEPIFVNFSIQPPYIPAYHGRDPFKALDNINRSPQISISELEFHGVIVIAGNPMALFTWRGNQAVRYTMKFRRLYSDDEKEIDGVVGDISDSEITLIQGDQKVVYTRK